MVAMKTTMLLLATSAMAARRVEGVSIAAAPLRTTQLISARRAGFGVAGSAALGSLIQGYSTGVVGGSLLFLMPHFGLRPAQVGAIATATTLGSVAGTFSAAALSDSELGRRGTLLCSAAIFVVAGLAQAWTPNLSILLAARLAMGVGIGNAGAVVPVYVAECAEPSLRGALATLPQLFISSGVLLSYLVTMLVAIFLKDNATRFRVTLGLVTAPALLFGACVARLPESPRHLLRIKKPVEAKAALRVLRGGLEVDVEFSELREALKTESSSNDDKGGWTALASEPALRKKVASLVLLQAFQQFAGINAVVYFTPQILKKAGVPLLLASRLGIESTDAATMLATAMAYAPKLPAMFLTMRLMDTWGRRRLLRSFIPLMGVATVSLAHALPRCHQNPLYSALALGSIAFYGVFFGLSLGPIPNILTSESFPTRVRSVAMTASLAAQFLFHTCVSFFFPVLLARFGAPPIFRGCSLVCAAAWLYVTLHVKETKQASLEDIAKKIQ